MQFIKNVGFVLIALMAMTSCEKEFLNEANPNGVSTDIYWANLEETESTLTSVYGGMLNTYLLNIPAENLRADMAFPRERTRITGAGVPFYYQQFNSSNSTIGDKWDACYQVAFRANQVIEALQKLEGSVDEDRWVLQMAQARFLRGLVHHYLHSTFNEGRIIIRDKVPQSLADFNKPVASSEEVIAFFRDDLKYAYDHLPATYPPGNEGRATAAAAATVLANSYLYEGEYEEAKTLYKDVIENPDYGLELVEDMNLLWTEAGEFNKESIFEINYTLDFQLEDSQFDEESFNSRLARFTAPINLGGGGQETFTPVAWLTHAYRTEKMDTLDDRNYVVGDDGQTRLRTATLRTSAMMAMVDDLDTPYYLQAFAARAANFARLTFTYLKKYTNHDIVADEGETGLTGWKSGRNVVVNRLAEVHLNLAECQIKTGEIDAALANINAIRARWGLILLGPSTTPDRTFDGVAYDATSLMNRLMYVEKPLELSFEGHAIRAIDLRRWGITQQRFRELAERKFSVVDYDYTAEDGSTVTHRESLLVEGEATPSGTPIVEYELTAENYNPDVHAYYPIPLGEVQNNSSIDN
ncbi:tetratricopeptide (TPR) repeat protein [Lewinella marina]|nr:RagB/SusD family nutrient uptake outer membrane protein [Neolewinella marina]NJB85419.1 tetratricopeptide (TPR) repeat protein [Neolewinella marina]